MTTEYELGWMRKQILKCKLHVNISLHTEYSMSHCSQALDIFGFIFKNTNMEWCCPLVIILWKNLTRIHFPDYVNLLYRLIYCWEKNHDSMSLQRFSLQEVPGLCYIIMLLKGQFEIICWVYAWHISGINFILKVPQYELRLVLLLFLSHTSFDKYHI